MESGSNDKFINVVNRSGFGISNKYKLMLSL